MENKTKGTILILGGDGYLGWTLGLAFANRTDNNVVLVDNLIKRQWEKEVDAKLLVPLKKPKARIAEYERIFGKRNLSFEKAELLNQEEIVRIIKKHKPSIIINAAQQPSAPFSMMNPKNAALTFTNNINGHLNTLWAIAQVDKNITYFKLGSAGCYMDTDTDFIPLKKKDLTFEHQGKQHKILQSFIPMQATDFYHQSKISDFLIDDLCAKQWNLKVVTIQQSTIFGATIDENHAPENATLSARFNYDAVFSTVLNRFICQLAIGHPLTVYGDGKQKTGIISLNDTVDNFMRFIKMDFKAGEHTVLHNFSHRLSIVEIAQKIGDADPSAVITYLKNPRIEGGGKLDRKVQLHPAVRPQHLDKDKKFDEELVRMIEFTKRHKDNIDPSIILPKVDWNVAQEASKKKMTRISKIRRPISNLTWRRLVGQEVLAEETV
jgi:UDP-sulfoquinovose synthase